MAENGDHDHGGLREMGDTVARSPGSWEAVSEDEEAQQSGRTPIALLAERAAAALRTSPTRSEQTAMERKTQRTRPAFDSRQSAAAVPVSQPLTSPMRDPAYVPFVSSPLRPSIPPPSRGGPGSITPQKRSSVESNASSGSSGSPGRDQLAERPRPRPPIRGAQHSSAPELRLSDLQNAAGPLTMKDLGSDYTRYPNPVTGSPRGSFVGRPSTHRSNIYSTMSTTSLNSPPMTPGNPFLTPNTSTPNLLADVDSEKNGSLIDDRLGAPYDEKGSLAWPLWDDKEEDDDEMHMPRDDDDVRYKPKFRDHFSRANIASTLGMLFMLLGLLVIFIALPILSYAGIINYTSGYETPLDQMPGQYPKPEAWAIVNNDTYPLLKGIRTGLVDPDTPDNVKTKIGEYGDEFELVFSDEFNTPNRTFYEGDDPFWMAPELWYYATQDLEWYDPDAVTTWDGTLEIRLDKFPNHDLDYRSGMLNSWNQMCFKGGILEVSMSLPGPAGARGLWPGVWTLGNLGRPGYLATTDGLWPYTYQACDVGITPNQSHIDGHSRLPGQKLNSCTCPGSDHPTPGTGRGAPEIDIAEVGCSWPPLVLPIATQSYQVAPFDVWYYPDYEFMEFPDQRVSGINQYTGGPYQEAISGSTNLNADWFDGKAYQRYSFEYAPGEGEGSYINWKVGGQTMFTLDGRALGPNGNIQARQISEEPMSVILNLGMSNTWTVIEWDKLSFPTIMRVDYVRLYQKKGEEMVTCDPPGFETTGYIKQHPEAYQNPNLTHWSQTSYKWPENKLTSDC